MNNSISTFAFSNSDMMSTLKAQAALGSTSKWQHLRNTALNTVRHYSTNVHFAQGRVVPFKVTGIFRRCYSETISYDQESHLGRWKRHIERAVEARAVVHESGPSLAKVIDGTAIAADIRSEIAKEVALMKESTGKVPGLAVVLVGSRKDSQTYVRMKKKACEEVGIISYGVDLPEDCTELEVLKAVEELNADPRVHGVLVQLPLPKHMSEEHVVGGVSLEKDVDGFHPLNMGRLAMSGRDPLFVPCTPKGCIELLLRSGVDLDGKRAVVIGRSNVVGMPAALLLQRKNATVTIVHSHTENPEEIIQEADVVIAAVGIANLVRGSWLKPGAVVIDVGINAVDDPSAKRGYKLVGDVCFDEALQIASAVTPVPGGVGPMTIAMLLQNTLISAKRAYGLE